MADERALENWGEDKFFARSLISRRSILDDLLEENRGDGGREATRSGSVKTISIQKRNVWTRFLLRIQTKTSTSRGVVRS